MTGFPPTFDPALEIRDHLPELEWRAAIERIARRHELGTPAPRPFPFGSDVVWSVEDAVVKLSAPKWRWQTEAEARGLACVAGHLPVRTPRPLAVGELDGWPYVVTERVPGVPLSEVWPGLARPERVRLAEELGALTRALHAVPVSARPEEWDAFVAECRAELPDRHRAEDVPARLVDEAADRLHALGFLTGDAARGTGEPVFLHTELIDQHVLVEPRGAHARPCALIDFADHRVGPFEYELPAPVEFVFRGEPGLLRAYLLAYGLPAERLDREYGERLLVWGLFHRYGSLRRMLGLLSQAPADLRELAGRLYDVR